jgi:catechol 2,3-dioxygenase-like lactoylglutathione lyase family enzyme
MKSLLTALFVLSIAGSAHAQLSPFNAAGITYGHVHLNVKDVEVQKKLWVEHFDGVVVQKGPLTAVRLPNMLVAFLVKEPTGPSEGTVADHFGFRVRDIKEISDKWVAAGYKIGTPFTGAEGFPNNYLYGPDGLKIEVQEDKTLKVKAVVNHVHLLSPDFEKMRDWYADMFSLAKRERGTLKTTADAGAVNLTFANAPKTTEPTKGRAIDHIGFEIKDLAAFCKQLEAKGIKFDVPYRDIPAIGLKIAYITDPWGTYIELTQGYTDY